MLFNFQGPLRFTQAFFLRSLSFGDSFILPHFQAFVKSFFKLFLFSFLSFRCESPLKLSFRPCVVGFLPVPIHCLFLSLFRSLVRQLCYNTTPDSNCQHLFSIFFLFLQIVLSFFPFFPFLLYFTKELLLSVDFLFTSY